MGGIHHLCDGARDETTAAVWDQSPAASLCGALNKREQKKRKNIAWKSLWHIKKNVFTNFWLGSQAGPEAMALVEPLPHLILRCALEVQQLFQIERGGGDSSTTFNSLTFHIVYVGKICM